MLPTKNNQAERYAQVYPSTHRYFYSCNVCGEVVSDPYLHDQFHRRQSLGPAIVFAKMSEIVTILWGSGSSDGS